MITLSITSPARKLALKTHPVKNPHDPEASKKFLQISEAYKRITDPNSFKDDEDEMGDFPSHEEELFDVFNMMMAEMFMDIDLFHSSSYFDDTFDSEDEKFLNKLRNKKKTKNKKKSMEDELMFKQERMQRQFDGFDLEKLMEALFEDDLRVHRKKKGRSKIQIKRSKAKGSGSNIPPLSRGVSAEDDSDEWETESSDEDDYEQSSRTHVDGGARRTEESAVLFPETKLPSGSDDVSLSVGDKVAVRGQER